MIEYDYLKDLIFVQYPNLRLFSSIVCDINYVKWFLNYIHILIFKNDNLNNSV